MSDQDGPVPKSDKKSPGFWFYTADYEKDMQILSLAAQGLWSRMLCWMNDNEAHRGFLELPTGAAMTVWDIGAKVGKTIREVEKAIGEMERVGIFSRDERGCIFSRRMARETHISKVRAGAAKRRLESAKRAANGEFAGDFAPANDPAKDEQNPTVSASVSDSDSSIKNHEVLQFPPPAKSWTMDEAFMLFMGEVALTQTPLIDADYEDAHREWGKLDMPERMLAVSNFREKREAGAFADPAMVMRPFKWLKRKEFNRRTVRARDSPASRAPRPPVKYFDPRTITG